MPEDNVFPVVKKDANNEFEKALRQNSPFRPAIESAKRKMIYGLVAATVFIGGMATSTYVEVQNNRTYVESKKGTYEGSLLEKYLFVLDETRTLFDPSLQETFTFNPDQYKMLRESREKRLEELVQIKKQMEHDYKIVADYDARAQKQYNLAGWGIVTNPFAAAIPLFYYLRLMLNKTREDEWLRGK